MATLRVSVYYNSILSNEQKEKVREAVAAEQIDTFFDWQHYTLGSFSMRHCIYMYRDSIRSGASFIIFTIYEEDKIGLPEFVTLDQLLKNDKYIELLTKSLTVYLEEMNSRIKEKTGVDSFFRINELEGAIANGKIEN